MKFSVVIPVYNVAPYLRACLDSVRAAIDLLQRTHPSSSAEVICVDDGSTDESGAILDEYRPYAGFRVVHQANAGEGAARNTGLGLISGEWYLFLDSDDVMRNTCLSDLMDSLDRHGGCELIAFSGRVFVEAPEWACAEATCAELDLQERLPSRLAAPGVWEFAYRTETFGAIRFNRCRVGADLAYVSHVLAKCSKCVVLEKEEHGYRDRPGSAVHSAFSGEKLEDFLTAYEEMFKSLNDSNKRLGAAFIAGRATEWIQNFPRLLNRTNLGPCVRSVWLRWFASMETAVRIRGLPPRLRLIVFVARRFRSRALTVLCCRLCAKFRARAVKEGAAWSYRT